MSSDRLFIPPRIDSSTLEDIVYRKNRKLFSNLRKRRGSEVKVGDHIAINVAGACNGNGKSWAQSAVGVYFGPSSRYNFSEEIDEEPHTSNRAHIRAATIGLEKVKKLLEKDKLKTSVVVVVTHSQYVVDGITRHIYKWYDNGWRNAKRTEVDNREDFQELDELVDELEDDYDVFVKFWWVQKEDNEEAVKLAEQAAGFHDTDDSDSDDSD